MPRDPANYQGSNPRLREQARGLLAERTHADAGCGLWDVSDSLPPHADTSSTTQAAPPDRRGDQA